jgi:hypothetical protein
VPKANRITRSAASRSRSSSGRIETYRGIARSRLLSKGQLSPQDSRAPGTSWRLSTTLRPNGHKHKQSTHRPSLPTPRPNLFQIRDSLAWIRGDGAPNRRTCPPRSFKHDPAHVKSARPCCFAAQSGSRWSVGGRLSRRGRVDPDLRAPRPDCSWFSSLSTVSISMSDANAHRWRSGSSR